MIELKDFGEMIMKQEWTVCDGIIDNFSYLGKNKAYDERYIFINGYNRKCDDPNSIGYNCSVTIPQGESSEDVEFTIAYIDSISKILSLADNIKSKDRDLPIKVFTYNNAKEKDEESFKVEINKNITLEIDKDHKLIVDNKYYALEEINSAPLDFIIKYEFYDYGIYTEEIDESKSYLLSNVKSCSPESTNIELLDIIKKPIIGTNIPNLRNLPKLIKFYNNEDEILNIELTYDEYEHPIFVASMHPLYYDNFDTGIIPGIDKFCIDQIDKSISDENDIIIYTREIYEIKDKEKQEELMKLIEESKKTSEPCIPIIN